MGISFTCRCERGQSEADCWLRTASVSVPAADTTLSNIAEPFQHPKCYARALGNCSQEISREHYISEGILKQLDQMGGMFIHGFPWQQTATPQQLPTRALASNILCKYHNERLSALDMLAGRFFQALSLINSDMANCKAASRRCWLFNGYDFERWLLKALCGLTASGHASIGSERILKSVPPNDFLNALFGTDELPPHWGLYFTKGVGDVFETQNGVGLAPLTNGKSVYGLVMDLIGIEFILAMRSPPENRVGSLLENATYRPTTLSMRNKVGCHRAIRFSWPPEGEKEHSSIVMEFSDKKQV